MEQMGRIEDKIDRIVTIQTQLQIDVAEHMRRTEIAENNIEKLSLNMVPVQKHVAFIEVSGRLLAVLAVVATIIGGLAALK
jgi:hypothetical protein